MTQIKDLNFTQPNQNKVRLYGQPDSAQAYEIRDFLNRTVVEFDWILIRPPA